MSHESKRGNSDYLVPLPATRDLQKIPCDPLGFLEQSRGVLLKDR